jgi:peptide-methionine (S)-S-oxide reductase
MPVIAGPLTCNLVTEQLALSFTPKWPLSHPAIRQSCCRMLKIFSHSAQRKSKSLFLMLSHCFLFISLCPQAQSGQANVAYFAGGCFWCTEAVFQQAPGVTSVLSGYMQKAETVQVTFDPAKTSYDKLLNLFWRAHDPTEVDAQGPDTGKQYRSVIFYADDQQRAAAEKSKIRAQKSYSKPIATEITRAGSFRPAPENHQNFCRKNPNNPYVRQIIEPKLKKLGLKKP